MTRKRSAEADLERDFKRIAASLSTLLYRTFGNDPEILDRTRTRQLNLDRELPVPVGPTILVTRILANEMGPPMVPIEQGRTRRYDESAVISRNDIVPLMNELGVPDLAILDMDVPIPETSESVLSGSVDDLNASGRSLSPRRPPAPSQPVRPTALVQPRARQAGSYNISAVLSASMTEHAMEIVFLERLAELEIVSAVSLRTSDDNLREVQREAMTSVESNIGNHYEVRGTSAFNYMVSSVQTQRHQWEVDAERLERDAFSDMEGFRSEAVVRQHQHVRVVAENLQNEMRGFIVSARAC